MKLLCIITTPNVEIAGGRKRNGERQRGQDGKEYSGKPLVNGFVGIVSNKGNSHSYNHG